MIYFAQVESGPIKIGCTKGPVASRISALRFGEPPQRATLLCSAEGDRGFEEWLHEIVATDCLRGEWFKPTPNVLALVEWCRNNSRMAYQFFRWTLWCSIIKTPPIFYDPKWKPQPEPPAPCPAPPGWVREPEPQPAAS